MSVPPTPQQFLLGDLCPPTWNTGGHIYEWSNTRGSLCKCKICKALEQDWFMFSQKSANLPSIPASLKSLGLFPMTLVVFGIASRTYVCSGFCPHFYGAALVVLQCWEKKTHQTDQDLLCGLTVKSNMFKARANCSDSGKRGLGVDSLSKWECIKNSFLLERFLACTIFPGNLYLLVPTFISIRSKEISRWIFSKRRERSGLKSCFQTSHKCWQANPHVSRLFYCIW